MYSVCMSRVHWGGWLLLGAFVGLAASALLDVGPASGWLSGLAILAGATAYAMMATNLLLAIRHPVLERLFGPLDRVYSAHRLIGTSILAVIGLHLVLIPIASVVDRGENLLDNVSVAIPLGGLGMLLLVGSIILAVNTKVPYDRWQKVHAATGGAFLVLTAHMIVGANLWFSLESPAGVLLGCFALLGIGSFIVRLVGKARGGVPYVVVESLPRERGIEIIMRPEGPQRIATHQPGQFVFLTATAGGARETHPFTLTSARGDERVSVLIRDSGDWTNRAQTGFEVGDRVRLDGPFGAFTPAVGRAAAPRQVWIAGGAGITPFLSVLRTARRELAADGRADHGSSPRQVELVVAAFDCADMPCWEELSGYARTMPWLTLTPAFSGDGGKLDGAAIERLAASGPGGTAWYLCGPASLLTMVERTLRSASCPPGQVHRERYEWRAVKPTRPVRRAAAVSAAQVKIDSPEKGNV